jgi:hypothetical protein
MFFCISKNKQDNFPYNYQTNNFVISLDEGWTHTLDQHNNDIWYKGYLDAGKLSDKILIIANEEEPTHSGNFCVIKVFNNGVVIRADTLRSFPLWYTHNKELTNLVTGEEIFWSDSYVMMNNDLSILHSKFDATGNIAETVLTINQVINDVDQILNQKIKLFLDNLTVPLRVFLSGGIDTTLLFSYIQKYTDQYEIVSCSHIDHDYFYLKNHGYLSNFWGYKQIHYWAEDCVLVSGAPGDEFSGRNPKTVDLLLKYHGSSFVETMNDTNFKSSLNYTFFKNNYLEKLNSDPTDTSQQSLTEVIKLCCAANINDWQHWHLGKTLTWTPLRDLEIFKLIARLSCDDLKNQLMNGAIQIELIRRNNPKLLTIMTEQKNSINSMENITNLVNI